MWALCVVCGKGGLEEVGEDEGDMRELFSGGIKNFPLESDGRNGERCMHFGCDFNGKGLKDSSFLCCIVIVISVEGRIGYGM
jgi:hypothetical protein